MIKLPEVKRNIFCNSSSVPESTPRRSVAIAGLQTSARCRAEQNNLSGRGNKILQAGRAGFTGHRIRTDFPQTIGQLASPRIVWRAFVKFAPARTFWRKFASTRIVRRTTQGRASQSADQHRRVQVAERSSHFVQVRKTSFQQT